MGMGMGSTMMPIMSGAMQTLRRAAVARASTTLNILQQVGASIGTAVMTVILTHGAVRPPAQAAARRSARYGDPARGPRADRAADGRRLRRDVLVGARPAGVAFVAAFLPRARSRRRRSTRRTRSPRGRRPGPGPRAAAAASSSRSSPKYRRRPERRHALHAELPGGLGRLLQGALDLGSAIASRDAVQARRRARSRRAARRRRCPPARELALVRRAGERRPAALAVAHARPARPEAVDRPAVRPHHRRQPVAGGPPLDLRLAGRALGRQRLRARASRRSRRPARAAAPAPRRARPRRATAR